ncbi:MAG: type IV pilus assembly protein PilM [Candidatus Eisenbacteria bacterium]|nr:type IV pilus assembly protein PilM [Candidatus Eisenbacteria bacterium]
MIFRKQRSVVGLDLGSHTIKAVELETTPAGPRLINMGVSEPLDEAIVDGEIIDRQMVVDALRRLFETRRFKSKRVVTSVSGRAVIVKPITMDRLGETEARQAIVWEAEQHVPYDVNDVVLDFEILDPQGEGKQMQVLLVAAKKDLVMSQADLLREAGLTPVAVDVDSFAIQNAVEVNYTLDEKEMVTLVNVGAELTNINVIQNGRPLFTKDLQLGGNNVEEALQRKLGLTQSEAQAIVQGRAPSKPEHMETLRAAFEPLSTGIERAASYIKSGAESEKIDRIFLSGGCARIEGLKQFLEERHHVPVEVVNPMNRIPYDPAVFGAQDPESLAPSLAVGMGLALRSVGDK